MLAVIWIARCRTRNHISAGGSNIADCGYTDLPVLNGGSQLLNTPSCGAIDGNTAEFPCRVDGYARPLGEPPCSAGPASTDERSVRKRTSSPCGI